MASRIPLFNFAYHPSDVWEKVAKIAKPEELTSKVVEIEKKVA